MWSEVRGFGSDEINSNSLVERKGYSTVQCSAVWCGATRCVVVTSLQYVYMASHSFSAALSALFATVAKEEDEEEEEGGWGDCDRSNCAVEEVFLFLVFLFFSGCFTSCPLSSSSSSFSPTTHFTLLPSSSSFTFSSNSTTSISPSSTPSLSFCSVLSLCSFCFLLSTSMALFTAVVRKDCLWCFNATCTKSKSDVHWENTTTYEIWVQDIMWRDLMWCDMMWSVT